MSIVVRLLILAVLGVVPPALLAAWHAADEQKAEIQKVSGDLLRVAQLVAAEQKRFIGSAKQLLLGLSFVPIIREGDQAGCSEAMRRIMEQ